jgi:hypothetical protein
MMQLQWNKRFLLGFLMAAALFGTSANARADIILSLLSETGSPGAVTFTYSVQLGTDSHLSPAPNANQIDPVLNPTGADLFTFYDVPGLHLGSETSTLGPLWDAATEQFVGLTPVTQNPPDMTTVENITFAFAGPTMIDNPIGAPPLTLGTVSFVSDFSSVSGSQLFYAVATQRSVTDPDPLGIANNTSQVRGPSVGVPAPASLVLALTGLPVFSLLARRRRKQTA